MMCGGIWFQKTWIADGEGAPPELGPCPREKQELRSLYRGTEMATSKLFCVDIIILIASSMSQLEKLLHKCENELYWLDMSINFE